MGMMKLKNKDINIIQTSFGDEEIKKLIQTSEDINNMSETNLYPEGTPTELLFKITVNDNFIGYIKLSRIRWFNRKCELSIMIKREYQSKGYGSAALESIIKYAFEKMNLHRLEAEVIEFNTPSIKLVEKFGFVREGVLREAKFNDGKYYDIFRYGLLKTEWEKGGSDE